MAAYDGAAHDYRTGEPEPDPELFDALEDLEAYQDDYDQLVLYDAQDPTTWICSDRFDDLMRWR